MCFDDGTCTRGGFTVELRTEDSTHIYIYPVGTGTDRWYSRTAHDQSYEGLTSLRLAYPILYTSGTWYLVGTTAVSLVSAVLLSYVRYDMMHVTRCRFEVW